MSSEQAETYINRELSWLSFNKRVQGEAEYAGNPLLERCKFLAIVASNLDEYIQVRYHRALTRAESDEKLSDGSGLTSRRLLDEIDGEIIRQQARQYELLDGLERELAQCGVLLSPPAEIDLSMRQHIDEIFDEELSGHLTPSYIQNPGELPVIGQKQLNFFIRLQSNETGEERYALLSLPMSFSRLYALEGENGRICYARSEDVLRQNLHRMFPDDTVLYTGLFRIVRNQDIEVRKKGGALAAVRDMLIKRRTGDVMRLEVEQIMPPDMLDLLMGAFNVSMRQVYRVHGPLDLNKLLMKLYSLASRDDLKYPRMEPRKLSGIESESIFARVSRGDILLYHPYHSFETVIELLRQAACDADVRGIKITLYRVSHNSPIIKALMDAAASGKQVTVLIEAQARFDEENNLFWGDRMQRAGCNVIYGVKGLKTHSKVTLITRKESSGIKRYVHLGTGNYHDVTARQYTDFGLITADRSICEDAVSFFHQIEGYGLTPPMTGLIKAPDKLRPALLRLIARERDNALAGKKSGIVAKMNSLCDPPLMEALVEASRAGVRVDLIVRGICCLRPEACGISDNIHVISIIGRFLEHARAFRFENGGQPEVYLSSADWMPRNLSKRMELMFPVKDKSLSTAVSNILALQLADSKKAWHMRCDGEYERDENGAGLPSQDALAASIDQIMTGEYGKESDELNAKGA